MRTALLIVALIGFVAAVSAQTGSYTLKGTYYTDNACTGSTSYAVSITNTYSSTTTTYPCITVGTGSTGFAINAYCYTYTYSGITLNYWYVEAYQGGSCPSAGTGIPTGYTAYAFTTGSDFSTKVTASGSVAAGCFQPTSCSSASTLIVPSLLLAALAFAASKLQL